MTGDLWFLTREGCANTETLRARLDDALVSMGQSTNYRVIDQDTLGSDDWRRGYPTPTILYKGLDIFGLSEPMPPYPEPT